MSISRETHFKIENIGVVPEPQKSNIKYLVSLVDEIFERNGMMGSQEQESFYECVEGQIILSLMPIKRKKINYLSLSDIHINDIDINNIILNLYREFVSITKFKKSNYKVRDKVTVARLIPSKSLGHELITREARIIWIMDMNIAKPDDAVVSLIMEDDIFPIRVCEGEPHVNCWRLV